VVGAGTAGYYAARSSQDVLRVYRPIFDAQRAFQQKLGLQPVFTDLDDFVARSSALIGSPQQVIEKAHRYHEQFGHSVLHLHADVGGLTDAQHRASLELFQSDIAPVLRREIPTRLGPRTPRIPCSPARQCNGDDMATAPLAMLDLVPISSGSTAAERCGGAQRSPSWALAPSACASGACEILINGPAI